MQVVFAFVIYFIGGLTGTALVAWVFSMVFQVQKQVRVQLKQLHLLAAIAKKQGVDETEVDEIMKAGI